MTADPSAAEESLRALARDLVEELAAGRMVALANDLSIEPLDPDSDEALSLAAFNVRGFQRTERTKTGRVITETVRPHGETREGLGGGFHPTENVSAGASARLAEQEKAWQAKGEKIWDENKWKKHAERIDATRSRMTGSQAATSRAAHDAQHPAAPLWREHGQESDQHLAAAQGSLEGTAGRPSAADAYRHLAEAHRAGVEQVLSRAQTPEEGKDVHAQLDRIQQHMEDLSREAGTKPGSARQALGSSAQHNERAAAVRDSARSAVQGAGETGDEKSVQQAATQHKGLVDPKDVEGATQRAREVAAARNPEVPPMPPYHHGAAAVYPRAAQAARVTTPGGTLSGHENVGRISPVQATAAPANPADAELRKMKQQIARFSAREDQRRKGDLQSHVAEMKAAEARYRGIAPEGEYRPLSTEEFAARKEFVSTQVENALRAGLATDQQHSLDGKGQVWSPERAMLHAEIVRAYMDRHVDVPSARQALFMGGLPGAGKSTALKDHPDIDLSQYAVINPDDMKEELMQRGAAPEVPGLSPMETAALVHEESAYLTDLVAHELERRGKNVAWDVTMKNHSITADRIRLLKSKNYRVHSLFVDVPVEKSAERVEARYRRGVEGYRKGENPMGGRFIPRSVVLAGEDTPGVSRARTTFDKLKPEFTSWELRDGTTYPATLVDKAGSSTGAIMSVEALRKLGTGSTEQDASAAESGEAAKEVAGLTQANLSGILSTEESEST